jgi:hypothetical protein
LQRKRKSQPIAVRFFIIENSLSLDLRERTLVCVPFERARSPSGYVMGRATITVVWAVAPLAEAATTKQSSSECAAATADLESNR